LEWLDGHLVVSQSDEQWFRLAASAADILDGLAVMDWICRISPGG